MGGAARADVSSLSLTKVNDPGETTVVPEKRPRLTWVKEINVIVTTLPQPDLMTGIGRGALT